MDEVVYPAKHAKAIFLILINVAFTILFVFIFLSVLNGPASTSQFQNLLFSGALFIIFSLGSFIAAKNYLKVRHGLKINGSGIECEGKLYSWGQIKEVVVTNASKSNKFTSSKGFGLFILLEALASGISGIGTASRDIWRMELVLNENGRKDIMLEGNYKIKNYNELRSAINSKIKRAQ